MLTLLVHKYSNGAKRLASRSANLVRRAPFTTDLTLWHSSRSSVLEPFRSRRKRSPGRAHTRRNPGGGSRFIISTSGRSTISPVFFVILHVAHTCFPYYPLFNAYRSLITLYLNLPRDVITCSPLHIHESRYVFLKPWNTVLYYLLPAISPSRKTGAKISEYDTVMPI